VASVTHLNMLGFELFELLPDAIIVVDGRGVIRYANHQAGQLFGQEPRTLVSAAVETLLPEHLRKRHIRHRTKYASEPRARPMGTGLALAGRRADGTMFPADIMLNPLTHLAEPMVLAVIRDVTDRRAIEEALQQTRIMFESFYQQSRDAIVVADETGKIDRVNTAAEVMFGLSPKRMLGQPIEMLLPEHFRHYMKDAKTRPIGTDVQLSAQRADGSEFPVDIMSSPIEIGQRRWVLTVVRDLTERRRAEAQVQLLMRELNHRIKNIFSIVQAMAQRTVASSPQEFVSWFRERIQGLSASHDLLIRNEWQSVPLAELVRSQLAHFSDLQGSRIAVRGPHLRITAAAAQAFGMALYELATNAGKYGALSTDRGRVEIVWGLEGDAAGERRFTMEWRENGGPTVKPPTQHGFGWNVLCRMTKMSLGADVTLEFAPTGVVWRLGCPADRVREGEAPRRPKLTERPVHA
jgi:PAS domain S-box-containing protein